MGAHQAATPGRRDRAVHGGEAQCVLVGEDVRQDPPEDALADAERLLEAARSRLANEAFTAKAPPAIVDGARAREAELADQVGRLRERLGR